MKAHRISSGVMAEVDGHGNRIAILEDVLEQNP